ncbi:MAG: hypothetical protein JNL59_11905 [Chitinophagaceae bacterium]|nr:hypothetical protein [Chitinophagaceae bacterium]
MRKISESLSAFPEIRERIEAMLQLIEHMILDKIAIEGDPYSNCQGISVYLPKGKRSYYTRIFTDYTRRYKASELPFDWYKLIAIAGKKMGYTS